LSRQGAKGSEKEVEAILQKAVTDTVEAITPYFFGFDDEQLESHIGNLMLNKGLTLGTAESCTGGYISHLITSVPGASRYFRGSIVAYDNAIKHDVLKVNQVTLENHGAVSEATVQEMVRGAVKTLKCDVAIAVSGISGPSGGTDDKPVGTVWIAVGDEVDIWTKKFLFTKDRVLNIKYTAVYALDMLRKFLSAR
jgi:nicotinamide-nucleotide amidase